jgi:hypothetical protein
MTRRHFLAGIGWAAAGAALSASRSAAAEFYQGKTLTMIVGFAPGGGVDATARAVARHLVRFIPGQPGVLVQNMEGAAGIVAASYLARRAAPDGLTLAVPGRSWFIEGIVNGSGNLFDPAKLTYVGSPGAVNSVLYVRSGTGIRTFAELKSSPRQLVFGALGSTTATATVPALLAADGWPIKVVLGYVSTARVLLALEQNEVDGFFTVEDSLGNRQDLINHTVIPVLQTTSRYAGLPLLQDVVPRRELPLLSLILAVDRLGVRWSGRRACRATWSRSCAGPSWRWRATRSIRPTPSRSICRSGPPSTGPSLPPESRNWPVPPPRTSSRPIGGWWPGNEGCGRPGGRAAVSAYHGVPEATWLAAPQCCHLSGSHLNHWIFRPPPITTWSRCRHNLALLGDQRARLSRH